MKQPYVLISSLALVQICTAATTPAPNSANRVPTGLQGSDLQSIHASHEAWRHRFEIHADGSVKAQHPAMQWRMIFDDAGFTARPNNDSWEWGL